MAKNPMTGRSVRLPDPMWETAEILAQMEGVSVAHIIRRALKSLTWDLHNKNSELCPRGHAFDLGYDGDTKQIAPGTQVVCRADIGHNYPCLHSFVWGAHDILMEKLEESGNGEAGTTRIVPAS